MTAVASHDQRIAIVGSGIAGLTCAHVLGPNYDVVLFEADDRLGGHANTVDVEDPRLARCGVDTGFIVHNDRTYPNLVALFAELGVETIDTTMSFAVTDRDRARHVRPDLPGVVAQQLVRRPPQRRASGDLANGARRRPLLPGGQRVPGGSRRLDHTRRDARGRRVLARVRRPPPDPARFGRVVGRSGDVRRVPGAQLAVVPVESRPALTRPTVHSGERCVAAVVSMSTPWRLDSQARSDSRRVSNASDAARMASIVETSTQRERFDRVILAVHADQALRMLVDPTPAEREVLGAIRFQPNRATLHTDTESAAASPAGMGGVELRPAWCPSGRPTITYDMTTLQHLAGRDRYLVSLNSDEWIDRRSVIASFDYAHPVFDLARDRRPATLLGDRRHSAACTTAGRGGVTASTRTGWCQRCGCATGSARWGRPTARWCSK